MRVESRTFCFISQGKVPVDISTAVRDAVFASVGERLKLTLAKDRKYASDPQRKYYFGVIVETILEAFLDAGNNMDKDDMHEWLKEYVGKLFKEVITPTGESTKTLRSYMSLDKGEAEIYHTKCRAWAAEMGIDVPEPNE